MATFSGSNLKSVKQQNLALLLRHVAQGTAVTRADLSRATGLSKMTVTNLVAELIEARYLTEDKVASTAAGRPPVPLRISPDAPLLCGMLIKRGLCQVVLTDLQGTICRRETYEYPNGVTKEALIAYLQEGYRSLTENTPRIFPAVGVASIGPLDATEGKLLAPADFYGIRDFDLVGAVKAFTGLPVFLMNDASAGALAETLYGHGKSEKNFVYLHIMNGIGAGLNLDGTVYTGQRGLAGEIGHTSVNMAGPLCTCGKRGCLDGYANLRRLQQAAWERSAEYPRSPLRGRQEPQWEEFIAAATDGDGLALEALEEFCRYLYHALQNLLSILDASAVYVGYPAPDGCTVVEDLLQKHFGENGIWLRHSFFGGDGPLVGAAALVAERIFRGELELI